MKWCGKMADYRKLNICVLIVCVCGDAFRVDRCYLFFFEVGCLGRMPNSFLFGIFFSTCFFVVH
jgi:hypothetical protein